MVVNRGGQRIGIFLSIFIGLLFSAEVSARVMSYLKAKNTDYLTAPFYRKKVVRDESEVLSFSTGNLYYFKLKAGSYSAKGFGYEYYTINSLGFRNQEFNPFDKNGKIRIFCVGDSTTFGLEAADNQTYPVRLQYYLDNKNGKKFEVINSGFCSYNSQECLNLLEYELIKYKPDLFIVMAGFNDIQYTSKDSSWHITKVIHDKLYYNSMLYTLLLEKISFLSHKNPIPADIYSLKASPNYKNNIEKIIKLCKDNNIKIVFVRQMACANIDLFLDDSFSWGKVREYETKYPNSDGYRRQYYHNELMKLQEELCKKYGVTLLDFRKSFYKALKDNEKPFRDVVHFSVKGDDILARLISENISDEVK